MLNEIPCHIHYMYVCMNLSQICVTAVYLVCWLLYCAPYLWSKLLIEKAFLFLIAASLIPGWSVSIENTTFFSIFITWTNLTSLLNRQVRHYMIFLNRTKQNALGHRITLGNQLSAKIHGVMHSAKYTVEVFGVDELGQSYRTLAVNTTTKSSKKKKLIIFYYLLGI